MPHAMKYQSNARAGAHMLLYSDPSGVTLKPSGLPGHVAIVCGNGADMPMAYETKVALGLMGGYGTLMQGVSAVDLPSLVSRKEQLAAADAVIVCCAEQPALAGLIVGLVDVPVIALPGVHRPDPTMAICAHGAPSRTCLAALSLCLSRGEVLQGQCDRSMFPKPNIRLWRL